MNYWSQRAMLNSNIECQRAMLNEILITKSNVKKQYWVPKKENGKKVDRKEQCWEPIMPE